MNTQIEELVDQLYNKHHGVDRADIKRMVGSEFKLIQEVVNLKSDMVVTLMHIGKVKPTPFREKQLKQKEDGETKV